MADAPTTTPVASETLPAASSGGSSDAVVGAPPATEAPAAAPTLLEQFDAEHAAKEPAPKVEDAPKEPAADPAPKEPEAKEGDKPADPNQPEPEAKKPEGEPNPEPKEPAQLDPIDYVANVKLPETLTLNDAIKGDMTAALDAFRADPTTGVQNLVDFHEKQMQAYAADLSRQQYETWNTTRADWQKQVMADTELGGAGHHTAMQAIARMRDLAVPESERPAFNEFLHVTGAGDHPAFLRMMKNFAKFFDEPPLPSTDVKPPMDIGKAPGARRATLYDHPRSNPNR